MVYDDKKILLQDRVKEDWRGLTLPGGYVEKDKSFVEAIIREIKEETGLVIKSPELCGIKQFLTEDGECYAKGMTTSDIEMHIQDIYGIQ